MRHSNKNHATYRASWKHFAARDVVVTVRNLTDVAGARPEYRRITVRYIDGCNGESRGTSVLTLAHVEVMAMQWISWTLVMPDGSRHARKGWLHADHDHESSVERDKAETRARREAADAHPLARELDWCSYEISLDYQARLGHMNPIKPERPRPTSAEVAEAPL
jgi:hypothetical protein